MNELINIMDSLIPPPVLEEKERLELLETCLVLIDDAIKEDPMVFIQPSFNDLIYQRTFALLCETIGYDIMDLGLIEALDKIIHEAFTMYATTHPLRSFQGTMMPALPNQVQMGQHIAYLENIPQPDQRTDEWYTFRSKYLTASSIWKAFGTPSSQNELIYEKCKPLDIAKYQTVNTESPMHWGQKYEPVSVELYERQYSTKVSDFGCLPHRTVPYLAASPDGINTEQDSPLFGRMLEIKNIVNREITGIPKKEYWIQMQLQMEVCELEECDFLETRFKEYANHSAFEADGTFTHTADGKQKGVILYFNQGGKPLYEYAPYGIVEADYENWEAKMMAKHEGLTLVMHLYWWLDEVSCVLVQRNHVWFAHVLPILDEFWGKIEHDRKHGYEHRAPNRKAKPAAQAQANVCMIDVNTLEGGNEPALPIDLNVVTA